MSFATLSPQPNTTSVVKSTAPFTLSQSVTATGLNSAALGVNYTAFSGVTPQTPQGITPEPSTFAIAGLGALGMIGYGLRRRKALGA